MNINITIDGDFKPSDLLPIAIKEIQKKLEVMPTEELRRFTEFYGSSGNIKWDIDIKMIGQKRYKELLEKEIELERILQVAREGK